MNKKICNLVIFLSLFLAFAENSSSEMDLNEKNVSKGSSDSKAQLIQSGQLHGAGIPQFKTNLNVAEILARVFPTFYELIKKAGYLAPIKAAKNVTIFAPTEEAFAFLRSDQMLGEKTYAAIFNNTSTEEGMRILKNVLNLHIISGRVLATELKHMEFIHPFVGRKLQITTVDGQIKINNSVKTISTDIIGTNGVVHAINAVIM